MVKIILDVKFKRKFKKIKDQSTRNKIIKQVSKIQKNPEIGKPMKHERRDTRELYVSPHRISYHIKNDELLYILDFYHKDNQ